MFRNRKKKKNESKTVRTRRNTQVKTTDVDGKSRRKYSIIDSFKLYPRVLTFFRISFLKIMAGANLTFTVFRFTFILNKYINRFQRKPWNNHKKK